jgi:hypothetical protein
MLIVDTFECTDIRFRENLAFWNGPGGPSFFFSASWLPTHSRLYRTALPRTTQ